MVWRHRPSWWRQQGCWHTRWLVPLYLQSVSRERWALVLSLLSSFEFSLASWPMGRCHACGMVSCLWDSVSHVHSGSSLIMPSQTHPEASVLGGSQSSQVDSGNQPPDPPSALSCSSLTQVTTPSSHPHIYTASWAHGNQFSFSAEDFSPLEVNLFTRSPDGCPSCPQNQRFGDNL